MGKEDVRAHYDRLSEAYDRDRNQRFFEIGFRKYRELLGPAPGRVLEVGCGTGGYLVELRRQGIEAFGCDYSPEMCKLARRNFARAGFDGEAAIRQADAEQETGFGDQRFDAVVVMDCWEFLEYPRKVIEVAHRALGPGGRLILFTPNPTFRLFLTTLEILRIKKLRPAFFYGNSTPKRIAEAMAGFFAEEEHGTLYLGLESYRRFSRLER